MSYYYFIATLITIVQTWAIRKFVNDEKLLKQIELAKTKPVKKSKFQQKLEEMQRMQEQRMKQKPKKKKETTNNINEGVIIFNDSLVL